MCLIKKNSVIKYLGYFLLFLFRMEFLGVWDYFFPCFHALLTSVAIAQFWGAINIIQPIHAWKLS